MTSRDYPEKQIKVFLDALAKNLYNSDPIGLKREPQTIQSLDNSLKFNVYDMHNRFKDPTQIKYSGGGFHGQSD